MKEQVNKMMESLKQKENLIFQNNMRLNGEQQPNNNNYMVSEIGENNIQQFEQNNNVQQFQQNIPNNIRNNVNFMGSNPYFQYTGINPYQPNLPYNMNFGQDNTHLVKKTIPLPQKRSNSL